MEGRWPGLPVDAGGVAGRRPPGTRLHLNSVSLGVEVGGPQTLSSRGLGGATPTTTSTTAAATTAAIVVVAVVLLARLL
jgi:hypothetical protein